MVDLPSFRFPELVGCRVRGSRAHVSESFLRSQQQQEPGDEYAGHEGEWRAFKAKLLSRTVGPRTRAVAAINDHEPEKPLSDLPPLLARHLASRQRNPWRGAILQSELRYNQLSHAPARLPGAQQPFPFGSQQQQHQHQQHGVFSAASHFRRPAAPDVMPPDEAFEMLQRSVADARRQRMTAPVWLHGKAYPVDATLMSGGAHRGGHSLSARY
jgi:hypothetical protein